MKKRGLLIVVVVLIVSIFLLTFFSRDYFNKRAPKVEKNELKIVLNGDQKLDLTEQTPVNDKSVDSVIPYIFEVKNKGNSKENYEILFEDFVSDDGKEPLGRAVLKYQLKSGGSVIKSGNLIDIKNNIITKDEINAKTTKKYELRVWVNANTPASEWVGKSYSYNVNVNQISN